MWKTKKNEEVMRKWQEPRQDIINFNYDEVWMKMKRIQRTLKRENLYVRLINQLNMGSQKNSAFLSLNDQNYDAFTEKEELDLQSEVWFCMLGLHNPSNVRCRDAEDRLEMK